MSKNNLNSNEIKIFKLIIIHKFNSISCWNRSCITYNLLDNKCRFMTKGPPDKIIKYCSSKSIPDIDKIFSRLIKDGYKIIAYATKILHLNQIDKNKNEEHYMKDLSFVGFIIIEKPCKKEISHIIEKIDKMNCKNSISSIISTNDNIYNSIEGSLKNGIINKNNVFVFDIGEDENAGKIIYAKYIYERDENLKDQKYLLNKVDSNRSLNKSVDKISINNNKKVKNNEYLNSIRLPDSSSRKLINSESYQEIQENKNLINSNTYEEKSKNNFFFSTEEENYFRSNFPTLKKKTSKYSGNVPSLLSNSFNILDREKKQSFNSPSPKKKHINFSRTEEFFNLSTFGKDSKGEIFYEDDSSHIKYKKRRPTTKAILNFTFRNSSIYSYECLFFTKYENQIQPFKHDCVLCFSGNLIEYIYNRKNKINEENNPLEKYKLDILMTLLKDRAKIFYSMSPEQKSFLIKIYRKYLKKSVCFVGINASDIESMALSNIGIMIGPPLNFNTLFCHYYLCDKSLLSIEKILKNGRSYYENVSHLLSVNSIFTILSIIFIISTYKLNTFINSKLYIFINTSVFLLCLSAFSIETNYAVDINSLIMDNKLYLIYNIIKIIGTIIIKVAEYPIL